eukprot:910906-Prorocentrum_minimum.AAC.4
MPPLVSDDDESDDEPAPKKPAKSSTNRAAAAGLGVGLGGIKKAEASSSGFAGIKKGFFGAPSKPAAAAAPRKPTPKPTPMAPPASGSRCDANVTRVTILSKLRAAGVTRMKRL